MQGPARAPLQVHTLPCPACVPPACHHAGPSKRHTTRVHPELPCLSATSRQQRPHACECWIADPAAPAAWGPRHATPQPMVLCRRSVHVSVHVFQHVLYMAAHALCPVMLSGLAYHPFPYALQCHMAPASAPLFPPLPCSVSLCLLLHSIADNPCR